MSKSRIGSNPEHIINNEGPNGTTHIGTGGIIKQRRLDLYEGGRPQFHTNQSRAVCGDNSY